MPLDEVTIALMLRLRGLATFSKGFRIDSIPVADSKAATRIYSL
jgi:hypothetical protein